MSKVSGFQLPSQKRRGLLAKATSQYAASVEHAMTYLAARGIREEAIAKWQLGYVLEPMPGHENMRGRLAVPYLTPHGPVLIKFRCIQDHNCGELGHGKYIYETGSTTYLFGVLSFRPDSRIICVCEGELDAISADIAGLPAVAVPGIENWKPHMQYCFEGYEEVIVLQDGDQAGVKLANAVARSCENTRVVTFPSGSDVNQVLVEHGPAALRQRVLGEEA